MDRKDYEWRSLGQSKNEETAVKNNQEKAMGFHWTQVQERRRVRRTGKQ